MIQFSKYTFLYKSISLLVIGCGIFSMLFWGFRPSIDFTGGTELQYQFKKTIPENVVRAASTQIGLHIQSLSIYETQIDLKTSAIDDAKEKAFRDSLASRGFTPNVLLSNTVGPVIGAETLRKTGFAALIAIVGILLYVAYAFKNMRFAIAAVIALVHDVLVVVGSYSLISHFFGAELDSLFVTALLTTMSFSVHDTIVVFDQIREYRRHFGHGDITQYADKALTDTMVRSFNNSMTIIFMLLALVLLGGTTIRFFSLTLLIGTITGTYSSPFVATPVAVWLERWKK